MITTIITLTLIINVIQRNGLHERGGELPSDFDCFRLVQIPSEIVAGSLIKTRTAIDLHHCTNDHSPPPFPPSPSPPPPRIMSLVPFLLSTLPVFPVDDMLKVISYKANSLNYTSDGVRLQIEFDSH